MQHRVCLQCRELPDLGSLCNPHGSHVSAKSVSLFPELAGAQPGMRNGMLPINNFVWLPLFGLFKNPQVCFLIPY